MGRRKVKLGRIRKNEERKRQAMKHNRVGRPSKFKKQAVLQPIDQVIIVYQV